MNCTACAGAIPDGARFCPSCGTPVTPPAEAARKLVTVVFCDLVGSTALSEALDPEALRLVVLRYFAVVRAAIEERGGTVEKFIGDAVMAVFGVPVMHEDDARRAAAAALAARDAVARLDAELAAGSGLRLRVRIGVHTGPAVAGTDVSSRQALVSGDTVNIAARLEQNAGPDEILIGPLTRQAIGAAARVEPVGPVPLKGIRAPLPAYRLLGVGADDPALLRRFDLPFVGRHRELAALDAALAGTSAGSMLLTVHGEAGIGKTRLVRAWLQRSRRPHAHGAGRCRPYGETGSLAPLAEAVQELIGAAPGPDSGALDVLSAGLLADGTPGPSLDATCAAVAAVLNRMSRVRPVIVALDDCHWASDQLLDVLDRLVALTRDAAVLVIRIARPELRERRPDPDGPRRRGVVLEALPRTDCELIVATRSEVGAHAHADPAGVLDVAGGNPFYLEQLLAAADDGGGDLPHGLQALIGARIDALDPAERTTLDLAAVLGREFGAAEVTALARGGPEAVPGGPLADPAVGVPRALAGLGRRHLVEPAPGPHAHRFRSVVIHEVTYRAMAKQTRSDRHARAADLTAGRSPLAGPATHLERAHRYRAELGRRDEVTEDLRRRAVAMLTAAGAQAYTRSDLAWAATLLDRALGLSVAGEPGRAGAARHLGEVRLAAGRATDGVALLRSVLATPGDPVQHAHARLALAVAEGGPSLAGATAVARATLPVFAAAGDELGQARAYIRMAQQQQLRGRHSTAETLLRNGLRHAATGDAEPELALALGAAAVSLWRGPVPVPDATARCRRWLATYGAPRPTVRVTLGCPLAVLLALDDRVDAARTGLTVAGRLAGDLGFPESAVVLPLFRAAVETLGGQPRVALDLLERAAAAAGDLAAAGLPAALGLLDTARREAARLLLDEGRHADAGRRLDACRDPADLLRADAADLDGLRARLAAAAGALDDALDLSQRAVAAAAATDSPIVRATALLDRALVLAPAGRASDAAAAAAAAGRCYAAKRHRPGMRRAAAYVRQLGRSTG
jgi:class 3 adenylate cyclase